MKKIKKKKEKYMRRLVGYVLHDDVSGEVLYFNHERDANTELYARIAYYDTLVLQGKLSGLYRCFIYKNYTLSPA